MMKKHLISLLLLQAIFAKDDIIDAENKPDATASTDTLSTWTVYAEPSEDSASQEVHIKNWSIESGDWYRIKDEDTQNSYWINRSELKKKDINIYSSSSKSDNQTQHTQVLSYRNKNLMEEKNWETFDKQFEEMIELQNKYMKAMRSKTLSLMPTSHQSSYAENIRSNFFITTSRIKQQLSTS